MASGPVTAPRPVRPGDVGPDPAVSRRRRAALLVPAGLVLLAAIVLAAFEGGYTETVWYPLALFLLALFVLVLVVAPPSRTDRSRPFEVAVVLLGLFTLWSFASILWADTPGDAWEGANRTLLYWIAFTLVGLRPWPPAATRWLLRGVALGIGALAVGLLVVTAVREDPSTVFVEGRISDPFGYANATADFWLIGFFPALHLAIGRDSAWPLRGVFLGVSVLLLETAVLSQSRGALLAFGIAATLFVLVHPRHWTALAAMAVPIALVALGWDQLLDVRDALTHGELDDALNDARTVIGFSALGALVLGTVAAYADKTVRERVAPSARRERLAERGFLALAAGVVVGVVVVLALSGGWIDDRWEDFRTTSYDEVESGRTRLTGSLGSGRYDYYRVSLNEFRDRPLGGVGAESFAVPYLEHRRTDEAPRYTHSLAFSLIATLGLVGALLFAGFLVAALTGVARVRLRATPPERGLAVGALGGFGMWFVHAQVDWLWEYPALTMLALGLLAVALRIDDRRELPGQVAAGWPVGTIATRTALAVLVVAGAVSLALAGAAARFERSAYKTQRTDPASTLSRLERAADLDPLSADPLIGRAVILRTRGRAGEARADLAEAIDREPNNWFAHFEAALLAGSERRWADAERSIRRTAELNPRQPLVARVRRRIASRRTIDPVAVERDLGTQLSVRLRPFDFN
ncbi:MAG TPA: O-antigen ligase family protein [Solirubrobacteraceae bacterium]